MYLGWVAILKRIPLPAVFGAAVALTSYIVASIYKQEYDSIIGGLQNYSQEILATRSTLLTSRISKAVIYNFEDQISTTRLQLLYMQTLLPSKTVQPLDQNKLYVVSPSNNEVRWQISSIENEMLDRLLRTAPAQLREFQIALGDYVEKSWLSGIDDLKTCVEQQDNTNGQVFATTFSKKWEDFDKTNKPFPDQIGIAAFATLMTDRFIFVRGAEGSTGFVPMQFLPARPADAQNAAQLWEIIDVKCFDAYRNQHDQLLSLVLDDVRDQAVSKELPYYAKRRKWLEDVEVALYALSILIALAKQAPARQADDEADS